MFAAITNKNSKQKLSKRAFLCALKTHNTEENTLKSNSEAKKLIQNFPANIFDIKYFAQQRDICATCRHNNAEKHGASCNSKGPHETTGHFNSVRVASFYFYRKSRLCYACHYCEFSLPDLRHCLLIVLFVTFFL